MDKLAIRNSAYSESREEKFVSPPRGTKFYVLSNKDTNKSKNVYFDAHDWMCGDFCFLRCESGKANRFVKYDGSSSSDLNTGIEGFYLFVCTDAARRAYVYGSTYRDIRKMVYIKIGNIL